MGHVHFVVERGTPRVTSLLRRLSAFLVSIWTSTVDGTWWNERSRGYFRPVIAIFRGNHRKRTQNSWSIDGGCWINSEQLRWIINECCIQAWPGIDPAFFVNLHLWTLEFIELFADGSLTGDMKETALEPGMVLPTYSEAQRKKGSACTIKARLFLTIFK